jgi:hypothetical protein
MNSNHLQQILAWCRDDLGLAAEAATAGPGFREAIAVRGMGGQTQVGVPDQGAARIVLQRDVLVGAERAQKLTATGLTPEALQDGLRGLILMRSSLLAGQAQGQGRDWRINVTHPIYTDGLSRHTLMDALNEVERFAALVEDWLAMMAGMPSPADLGAVQQSASQALGTSAAPSAPAPAAAPARVCPQCGRPVPAGKKFCAFDGTPVP